ncbi:MAG: hypothetical protein IJF33_03590 [Clostridia bacterium]|nr:hypothetical protein [Clostridia bacterium]
MNKKDAFSTYLQTGSGKWHTRALTDKSLQGDRDESVTNVTLATYGDALLKLALCEILLDHFEELTIEKAKYESDVSLIKIAEHYDLLQYLHFNRRNREIPKDYDCRRLDPTFTQSKKERVRYHNRRRKYIATAIEAVLGAIYKDHRDFAEIVEIVRGWIEILDRCHTNETAVKSF